MSERLTRIFDTHAHYTDQRFAADQAQLLQDLPAKGVQFVLTCGSDLKDSTAALALAHAHPNVYAACGVHPHQAGGVRVQEVGELRAMLQDPRCVAVGEIGLDYHYDFSPKDVQRRVFQAQLDLALELDLPVILHDREAHEDMLGMLRAHTHTHQCAGQHLRGVVHCFSGSAETARELLALGLYLGFGGIVTFKNARRPLAVAAEIPLDRLLLETDAPYCAPEPFRGRRCESWHIAHTAGKIAAARGMQTQALIDICNKNGRRLFGI